MIPISKLVAYAFYAKKALAAAAVLAGVVAAVFSDGVVDAAEVGELFTAATGVLAVFGLRNGPKP